MIDIVLFGIFGRLGDGKTLALTYLTFDHWFRRKEKIYSNYHLFKIPFIYIKGINQLEFIKGSFEKPAWAAADEMWRIIKARTPMLKQNDVVYTILGKSRKRVSTWAFTSQLKRSIDRNVVDVLDFISKPSLSSDEEICRLDIFAGSKASVATLLNSPRFITAPFKMMYDSITSDEWIYFIGDGKLRMIQAKYMEFGKYKEVLVPSLNKDNFSIELKSANAFMEHYVEKDGFKITIEYGRKIKVTGDHSLFTLESPFKTMNYAFKKDKITIKAKPVRDMKIGDYLVLPKTIPIVEKDIDELNVADFVNDKMKSLKRKNNFDLIVKVDSEFIKNNYEKIKEYMVKNHGKKGYGRLYLFKKNNYLPYDIVKIFDPSHDLKISSRYIKNFINGKINIDDDLLWLLGLYVAEGSTDKHFYYINYATEHRFSERASNIIEKIFDFQMKKKYIHGKISAYTASNRCLSILFQGLTKDLSWIAQLPLDKLKYFIKGWWDGDGHHNGNCEIFKICTANERLVNPLLFMLGRFGLVPSITRVKGKEYKDKYYHISVSGITKEKANDILSWDNKIVQNTRSRSINDVIFAKITKIEPFHIKDKVYDFSVKDNESFLAGNMVMAKNTLEEIDMENDVGPEMKIIFQPNFSEEHGFCCECEQCGTKFFKTWDEADAYAGQWWEIHWKEVFEPEMMEGEEDVEEE